MAIYKICEKLPFTIAIQFDREKLRPIIDYFNSNGLKCNVSSHISIKYLGYEEDLNIHKIEKLLKIFNKNKRKFIKKPILVNGADLMCSENAFFKNLLYLKIVPYEYLFELHKKIIELFNGNIDYFIYNDMDNYIPHISCGIVGNELIVKELNSYISSNNFIISDWHLSLHTANKDYIIL